MDEEGSALSGQFQTVARQRITKGTLIPFVGRVAHDSPGAERTDYEVFLSKKVNKQDTILLVDLRCAAAYVNDAFGPNTPMRQSTKDERSKHQNVSCEHPSTSSRSCFVLDRSNLKLSKINMDFRITFGIQ